MAFEHSPDRKTFLNHECFTTFDNALLHYLKVLHKIFHKDSQFNLYLQD